MLFWIGKIVLLFEDFLELCKSKYKSGIVNNRGGAVILGGVALRHPENIYIGQNSFVNGGMLVAGEKAKITIGDNCLLSYGVHIRTSTHKYKDRGVEIRKQGMEEKDIVIEDDVWIGYGAQVLSGVLISKGAVVGANAVVTKNVPEYAVVAGAPARIIGSRNEE